MRADAGDVLVVKGHHLGDDDRVARVRKWDR
jgi:hypothetical protein